MASGCCSPLAAGQQAPTTSAAGPAWRPSSGERRKVYIEQGDSLMFEQYLCAVSVVEQRVGETSLGLTQP